MKLYSEPTKYLSGKWLLEKSGCVNDVTFDQNNITFFNLKIITFKILNKKHK
jgi:hypothetical protein